MGNVNSDRATDLHQGDPTQETSNDPRSPSQGVSRTPLRLETSSQTITEKHHQNTDPRSPSGCIDRTPIQICNSGTQKDTARVKVVLNYENMPPQSNSSSTDTGSDNS